MTGKAGRAPLYAACGAVHIPAPWPVSRKPSIPPPPPEPASTTGGPAPQEAGGTLTIDLGAIAANYKTLRARVMPSECAAVVKGDAYGCGIDQVTAALTARRLPDLLRRASVRGAARARRRAARR